MVSKIYYHVELLLKDLPHHFYLLFEMYELETDTFTHFVKIVETTLVESNSPPPKKKNSDEKCP